MSSNLVASWVSVNTVSPSCWPVVTLPSVDRNTGIGTVVVVVAVVVGAIVVVLGARVVVVWVIDGVVTVVVDAAADPEPLSLPDPQAAATTAKARTSGVGLRMATSSFPPPTTKALVSTFRVADHDRGG